jgi:outer membrane receptor protein involved in Fe transport
MMSKARNSRRGLLIGSLMASSMLTGLAAHAQTAEPSGAVALDEVVVTAQKRSENLQDVPVSIQAIGEQRLSQLNVSGFTDYVQYLPSVSFSTSGPGFGQVYMRGVASGGDGNHSGSLPSVGVYLDEQPITTIQGALDIHVYDIARVEALSGPQGTLYGASSQAGTLRIITNKPDPTHYSAGVDFEANSVDHGGVGHVEEGFVNLPLSDTVAVRLVGWNEKKAGYIDNVLGTRTYNRGTPDDTSDDTTINNASVAKKNYNTVETYGGRAALRIELNDNWTITPGVMAQMQKSNGAFSYDPSVGDLEITHFRPESTRDFWSQAQLTVEGKISNLDVTYAGSYLRRDDTTHQDYSDYSYFYDQAGSGTGWVDNAGNMVDPTQYISGRDGYQKTSHEFRVATPQDKKLRFVGGLFYQRQQHYITQDYIIDGIADDLSVTGWKDTIWLTAQKRVDRDKAAFGELSYDVTDHLTVQGGIRFFKAHNTLVGFAGYAKGYASSQGEAKCFAPSTVSGAPCTSVDKGVKESGNSPKVTATYKFDSSKLVYLTYSKGFRPGGVNRRSTLPPYGADYLKNYEFGWKTSWFDNRFRWNGAAFVEDWDNFQFAIVGAQGLTEIHNANSARIKGLESDLTFAVAHGFTLTASGAYTDAKLTANYCGKTDDAGTPITVCPVGSVDFPDGPQAAKGTRLPLTPKWKGNLTARYEFSVGDYDAFLQAAAVSQTKASSDLRTLDAGILGDRKGYTMVDLSGGLSKDDWSMSLYAKNITDERAQLNRYAECPATTCGAITYVTPSQPRTVGVKVGRKF